MKLMPRSGSSKRWRRGPLAIAIAIVSVATASLTPSALAENLPYSISSISTAGQSYYLAESDGTVLAFGPHANIPGSRKNLHLNAPIVGMVLTVDGLGYYLVASDGGVFVTG